MTQAAVLPGAPFDGSAVDNELRIDGIAISYGGVQVVRDITIVVPPKGRVALIGPNGAGKSSIINAVCGIVRPRAGRIFFGSTDLSHYSPQHRARIGIGRTYQNLELFPTMTVFENLQVPLEARRVPVRERLDLRRLVETRSSVIEECLRRLGLTAYSKRRVDELPYGLRKLVELGRCIVCGPKIVLLDEPAAGLDRNEKREFVERLDSLIEQSDISVLLVEHDMTTVQRLCGSDVHVLDAGHVIARGTFDEVRENPEVAQAYLGTTDTDASL